MGRWNGVREVIVLFFLFKDFIYLFLEGKGGRNIGKETSMCGCLSHTPYWDPGLQPRHVPWLGIARATLWFTAWCSIHWATPVRAKVIVGKDPRTTKLELWDFEGRVRVRWPGNPNMLRGAKFSHKSPREALTRTAKVKMAQRHSVWRQEEQDCRGSGQTGDWRGSGFNGYLVSIQCVQDNSAVFVKNTRIRKTSVPSEWSQLKGRRLRIRLRATNGQVLMQANWRPELGTMDVFRAGNSHQISREGTGESFVELDLKEGAGL